MSEHNKRGRESKLWMKIVDKRGWEGVVGSKSKLISVYHMTKLSLIFSTGLGMTLQSQYYIPLKR